jgi:hypothetical protein
MRLRNRAGCALVIVTFRLLVTIGRDISFFFHAWYAARLGNTGLIFPDAAGDAVDGQQEAHFGMEPAAGACELVFAAWVAPAFLGFDFGVRAGCLFTGLGFVGVQAFLLVGAAGFLYVLRFCCLLGCFLFCAGGFLFGGLFCWDFPHSCCCC